MKVTAACLVLFLACVFAHENANMPLPFKRVLSVGMNGTDVTIAQNLLLRSPFVTQTKPDGIYGEKTKQSVIQFQQGNKLSQTGTLDVATATTLIKLHFYDGYKDDGKIPAGYLYKVFVPVYKNRSIETTATLYDKDMNAIHRFTVRSHGQQEFNELTSSGNTPTGLMTFDLNSPEDDPKSYGPYPVNRACVGIAGNAGFALPYIRNGILLHTGEWDDWKPPMPMPNSHGCLHAYPDDIKTIWKLLVDKLGVKVRPNPFGKLPYPYKEQGVLSIELQD